MLITGTKFRKTVQQHEHTVAIYDRNQRLDREEITALRNENEALRSNMATISGRNLVVETDRDMLRSRLDEIAAMETPGCAHIGKKMARVARGQ